LYTSSGNLSVEATAFRKALRTTIRFGPNRLSRIVISHIVTNILNGFGDGQVTVPGGVSFNFQLENIPYVNNGTTIAIEFDVDTDVNEGTLVPNATNILQDPTSSTLNLQNPTEDHIEYGSNDTRRIRWKRAVYCDNGKIVVVRSRFVLFTGETPDGGFVVRKKLYVTFYIPGDRCLKVFWDPTNDMETPPDNFVPPTGTSTGSNSGSSSGTGSSTGTGSGVNPVPTGNNVSKLIIGFGLIALLI